MVYYVTGNDVCLLKWWIDEDGECRRGKAVSSDKVLDGWLIALGFDLTRTK